MRRPFIVALTAIFFPLLGVLAGAEPTQEQLDHWANDAVSENRETADPAIRSLREAGPAGLTALASVHADIIKQSTMFATSVRPATAEWLRLRGALDAVGAQHDCHASQLYWYTDFEEAKAAARREGKPILSLRLLGNLTDEFSCANSRFFRATLYSNPAIGQLLRDKFVLHWKSVRPVPKVTIDFGDGRKLERTLTGNSIHYVLDAEGRTIDAIPGLYGPQAFARQLEQAEKIARQAAKVPDPARQNLLAAYHTERVIAIDAQWRADLQKLGIAVADNAAPSATAPALHVAAAAQGQPVAYAKPKSNLQPPTAAQAAPVAESKYVLEMPMLKATTIDAGAALAMSTTDDVWNRIALLHADDAKLDPASVALIRSQHPAAAKAALRAVSKMYVEDPLVRIVRKFQGSIAIDSVRDEYLYHRQIHAWLAQAAAPNVDVLNERVYAQLFLTPSNDPWLGLMPADTYTALENDGIAQTK